MVLDPAQTDDVAAFVAGWGFDNKAGAGDYASWTHGDMNHDGRTDVNDFFLLRGALNEPISGAALTALFGGQLPFDGVNSVVPEPGVVYLSVMVALLLVSGYRRGRERLSLHSFCLRRVGFASVCLAHA